MKIKTRFKCTFLIRHNCRYRIFSRTDLEGGSGQVDSTFNDCCSGKFLLKECWIKLVLNYLAVYNNILNVIYNSIILICCNCCKGNVTLCKACLAATNKDGVSIFNYQLVTKQLLVCLLEQLNEEPPWAEHDYCMECGNKFGITTRKHHWWDIIYFVINKF